MAERRRPDWNDRGGYEKHNVFAVFEKERQMFSGEIDKRPPMYERGFEQLIQRIDKPAARTNDKVR